MPMPLEMTLEDARIEVMLRIGMSSVAAHNATIQPLVDSAIRRAHRMYYHEVEWQGSRRRGEFGLIPDQHIYDFPDATEVGQIGEVWAENDDERPTRLEAGTTPHLRERLSRSSGRPQFYEFVDREIHIYPAPDASWETVHYDYQVREPGLTADTERLIVDSELVVMQAVVFMRIHLGQPGVNEEQAITERYARRIKAQQASGRPVHGAEYPQRALYGSRWQRTAYNYNYRSSPALLGGYVDQLGYLR